MGQNEQSVHGPAGLWLVEEWAARLSGSLGSMADKPPRVVAGSPEPGTNLPAEAAAVAAAHGPVAWWEQTFSLWPEAPLWIGVPEQAWSALGSRILEAAGIEEPGGEEVRGTFVELLAQSLESLAHGLGAVAGVEVVCDPRREAAAPGAAHEFRRVVVSLGDSELPPFLAAVSRHLAGARLPSEPAREAAVAVPASRIPNAPGAASGEARMLELLLDVELPVSISFGRTHLPLKETLKLTTGSIVELNRGVGEPVDVIVNNCVIARGEVVVIDGNYGVRVREIMSRQERWRNLS